MQYRTPGHLHMRGCEQPALRDHGNAQRLLLPPCKFRNKARIKPVLVLLQIKLLLSMTRLLAPNPVCDVVLM